MTTMKMEAASPSEALVLIYHFTWHHFPYHWNPLIKVFYKIKVYKINGYYTPTNFYFGIILVV
jgi:hypothetical protein